MASRKNDGKPTDHPALLPGLGVERTGSSFGTNWGVFAFAAVLVAGVIAWGAAAPESLGPHRRSGEGPEQGAISRSAATRPGRHARARRA